MARGLDDLRSQVLGRATEAECAIGLLDALLGETEVSDADVTFAVEQHVLGLEVAINNVPIMESADGDYHFGCVVARSILGKSLFLAQIGEELAAIQEIDKEIQLDVRLERVMETDNVRILDLLEDISLGYSHIKNVELSFVKALTLRLHEQILLDQLVLLEYFHGVRLLVALLLNQEDLTKRATTNNRLQLEVVHADLIAWHKQVLGGTRS